MKTLGRIFLLSCIFLIGSSCLLNANNVQITSGVTLTGQDVTNDYIYVTFDIAWDNSWRDATNWDAVWVFFKFSNNNAWKHGYLSTDKTEYSIGTNNGVVPAFSVGSTTVGSGSNGMGVFIYRNAEGAGSVNWQTVKLKWYYGQNGLNDEQAANASIKLFAIEMVYVPTASFELGCGSTGGFFTRNYANSTTTYSTIPSYYYTIGSESAINARGEQVSGSSGGFLSWSNYYSATTIPASFPKGYAAFYCMKYEITQEQYVEFLNSLQPAQQSSRVSAVTVGKYMSSASTTESPQYRNGIRCMVVPTTTTAGTWGCDLNGNGTCGESDDGQNVACNYIRWSDAIAYADWAGLRPMTELEYEKASKGSEHIPAQYAWGTVNVSAVTSISNSGKADEVSGTVGANAVYSNQAGVQGPMRVGCFATGVSSRESAGASYYGIMELSGNVAEQTVYVTSTFDGVAGDGELYSNGNTDISTWTVGISYRGGSWASDASSLQSGYRSSTSSGECNGFRCVRTAQ